VKKTLKKKEIPVDVSMRLWYFVIMNVVGNHNNPENKSPALSLRILPDSVRVELRGAFFLEVTL
jgi:hypothetical protein